MIPSSRVCFPESTLQLLYILLKNIVNFFNVHYQFWDTALHKSFMFLHILRREVLTILYFNYLFEDICIANIQIFRYLEDRDSVPLQCKDRHPIAHYKRFSLSKLRFPLL